MPKSSNFSLSTEEIEHISSYVNGQLAGFNYKIVSVLRAGSEKLYDTIYSIYDVRTTGEHYWVIDEPLNLHSQKQFPSYDEALSFHIGLSFRVAQQWSEEPYEETDKDMPEAWAIFYNAQDKLHTSREIFEYQALAATCREALLAFVRERQRFWKQAPDEFSFKEADFKNWTSVFATSVVEGSRREYLKKSAAICWDLTNAMLHNPRIDFFDCEILLLSVKHFLETYSYAFMKLTATEPLKCKNCGSQKAFNTGSMVVEDNVEFFQDKVACPTCGFVILVDKEGKQILK